MGLAEYQLRMEAYQLKRVQEQESLALQAWMNQAVQATKGSSKHPRPKFKQFKEFFDTQEQIDRVRSMYEPSFKSARQQRDASRIFAKRIQEFKKLKAEGKIIPWNERKEVRNGRTINHGPTVGD